MPGRKRTRSSTSTAHETTVEAGSSESGVGKPSKIPRLDSAAPITFPDDDSDLAEILELIKGDEESETLAKLLQKEWDDYRASAHDAGVLDSPDVIMLDSDSEEEEVQEVVAKKQPTVNGKGKDKGKGRAIADTNGSTSTRSSNGTKPVVTVKPGEEPPNECILVFRELFTGRRRCSRCNQDLECPRGDVRFVLHLIRAAE